MRYRRHIYIVTVARLVPGILTSVPVILDHLINVSSPKYLHNELTVHFSELTVQQV